MNSTYNTHILYWFDPSKQQMDHVSMNATRFTPQDEIPDPKNLEILFHALIPNSFLFSHIDTPFYNFFLKFKTHSSLFSSAHSGLVTVCFGAAIPYSCGSIYKSFAQCLLTLGDSLVDTQKDQSTQDIDSICR